jgi:sugar lactone lactonase YvrE
MIGSRALSYSVRLEETIMKSFELKMHLIAQVAVICGLICVGSRMAQAESTPPPTGETVYVSTFTGGQIVKVVDGVSPATTVINSSAYYPEDIVVGPDGKIYICDADQNQIRRMNQDGTDIETVYSTNPAGPEGPSFNTLGDLYFNTRGPTHTGVWKIPASQLSPIPGGGATPVNVVSNAPVGGDGSSFGEGTTFDANDKLLFVDRSGSGDSGGRVWRFDPVTSALTPIITGLGNPFGIAVDSVGDIFVSNSDTHQVLRYNYNSDGVESRSVYVDFTSCATCSPSDSPAYLQFDASDKLYVVTNDGVDGLSGKLWRADPVGNPPSTGTLTLLVNSAGFAPNGAALGLGLPATTFTTAQQMILPGNTYTFTDGTIITQTLQLPANVNMGNAAFMAVSFMQIAPAVFDSTRLPATSPNTWSGGSTVPEGTTLTPLNGAGGNGIVAEKLCYDANHNPIKPCEIFATTPLIQLTSVYNTQSPQPNPGNIIATDGQNDWANITVAFNLDPTLISASKGLNTDEAIVNLPLTSDLVRLIGEFLNAGCIDNAGVANALTSKLAAAQDAIDRGDIQTAINILTAFEKQVQAQSGKHILTSCSIPGVTSDPVIALSNGGQILIDNLRTSITPDPITGYVVDSNGAGISGATVTMSAGATTTSDITGFYFFPTTGGLASTSSYTVQVTLPSGFTTSTPAGQMFSWSGRGMALSNFVLK